MNTCPLVVTELLWIYTAENLTAPTGNYLSFTRWEDEPAEQVVEGSSGEEIPGVGVVLAGVGR